MKKLFLPLLLIFILNFCKEAPKENQDVKPPTNRPEAAISDTATSRKLPPNTPVPINHLTPLILTIVNNAPGDGTYKITNDANYTIIANQGAVPIQIPAHQWRNFIINDASPSPITFNPSEPSYSEIKIIVVNLNNTMLDADYATN